MELLEKVILSSCLLSAAVSAAEMLIPAEKFSRQLRFIFSLIFITGVITAFMGSDLEFDLPVLESGLPESYDEVSRAAEETALRTAEASVADMAERILAAKGVSWEKVTAVINKNADGSISINEIGYKGDEYDRARAALREGMGDIEVVVIG